MRMEVAVVRSVSEKEQIVSLWECREGLVGQGGISSPSGRTDRSSLW